MKTTTFGIGLEKEKRLGERKRKVVGGEILGKKGDTGRKR